MQFAYEDYLLSLHIQRPSDLPPASEVVAKAKQIYFLRNIAVPEVMDVSFWLFKKSRETMEERIAVCNLLMEMDSNSEAKYRDEIKEITQKLSLQDGLEDVDSSRVYIDIAKLQRWAETELKESFDRYQALLRAGIDSADAGDFIKVLKDFVAGKGTLERFADYPADEAGQLLIDMYESITEKYLHDPDIGLDAYLSMRIRHGSLAGHIRGPLEEQGLLAVRDKGTNQYRMLRPLPIEAHGITAEDWHAANRCVEEFSRVFDSHIDALVRDHLQIRRAEKPKGLFAFETTPLSIFYLRAHIDKGSSLAEFIGQALTALDVYLGVSLQSVRRYITEEFNDNIGKSIDEFRKAIDRQTSIALRGELQELIGRVSPELQASIERVASWFAPDAERELRALRTMEQIVEIAVQATNNAHRGFTPDIRLNVQDLGLQSNETFIVLTDILFTILDNIYTHSGLDSRPIINIGVTTDGIEADGSARIRVLVSNTIAPHVKTSARERKLQRIRDQIASGDYRALSKAEGGTGFLKLKRIIADDSRQTLEFGYRQDRPEFFVEVHLIVVFQLRSPPAVTAVGNAHEVTHH